MKSFLKQINESFKSLQEKDWDGDGKQESDTEEYMGVKDRAIKQAMKKEAAKPDFLDVDGDGNTTEPWKKAEEDRPECDSCYGSGCDHCKNTGMKPEYQDLDEMSTTASMGAVPQTPYVFRKADDKTVEALGYKRVSKISNKKMHTEYDRVQEAMDKKYEQLIEGYRDFVLSDSKMSPARKVNASIRDVAKKLKEIEQTVEYTGRLKTESGIAHSGFSSGTHNALRKISERLIKISERVRSLGE